VHTPFWETLYKRDAAESHPLVMLVLVIMAFIVYGFTTLLGLETVKQWPSHRGEIEDGLGDGP
jgi:hypothetical protein